MNGTHKGFIEYLQTLPEPSKKRVLIITTAVIMALVIYFWLSYFNNIIAGANLSTMTAENSAPSAEIAPQPAGAAGIWQRLGNSMAYISGAFANAEHALVGFFESQGQYSVQPQQ